VALRVPPIFVVFIAGLLIWAVARYLPFAPILIPGNNLAAGLLAAIGAVVIVLGVAAFRRAKTTLNPLQPGDASVLVASGIYRFSRNPMYLGFAILLLAWVIYLSAWPAVLVVAAYVAYMSRFQIKPEERALGARFGQAFVEYKQAVPRWIWF